MKNFIFILFPLLFLLACEDPNIESEDKTTVEMLTSKAWQLEKYTDTQGKTINDGSLNTAAKLLYGMIFDFNSDKGVQEVRGIDKLSKNIINRGSWSLKEDVENIILDIDIVGFSGDFEIINLTNTSMTLQAKTENLLIGVGPEIYLVFSQTDI